MPSGAEAGGTVTHRGSGKTSDGLREGRMQRDQASCQRPCPRANSTTLRMCTVSARVHICVLHVSACAWVCVCTLCLHVCTHAVC